MYDILERILQFTAKIIPIAFKFIRKQVHSN
jgi:hypothetical protein